MKISAPKIVLSGHSAPLSTGGFGTRPSSGKRLLTRTVSFWREFFHTAFTPYYPERHYMRGPGPACAKRDAMKNRNFR